ncbi:MAG TPA: Gfo/Idh/MocA family oxidoreductase [Burkholderiales bacterium]|nr:Gfo/Idh/MocA family oxidoreductase [Burkholderiales bacterium]
MVDAALIGLGWWGKNILKAVQGRSSKIRFVHGVSKELDEARPLAEQHGFTLSSDLDAALEDKRVHAIVLATPHSLHPDQIVEVARAGKPVFCEKPLSLKRADAARALEAVAKAGVPIGVGQNKRFWPSMDGLRQALATGILGKVLHVEGHYSNENSGLHFSDWRADPNETPGAGMTGTGIHILDAFVNACGPVAEVQGQFISTKPSPDPRDTISVLFRFENNVSGLLGAVRASPFYWRVQVFGDEGSVEAIGETGLVVRTRGGKTEVREFPPRDSLLAEFEHFADAVEGRAPYPITPAEMLNTVGAFEAITRSLETGERVRVAAL